MNACSVQSFITCHLIDVIIFVIKALKVDVDREFIARVYLWVTEGLTHPSSFTLLGPRVMLPWDVGI